jgi:hypothetical protein
MVKRKIKKSSSKIIRKDKKKFNHMFVVISDWLTLCCVYLHLFIFFGGQEQKLSHDILENILLRQ